MSWSEGISNFINTPNLKISQKLATVIILISAVLIIDNLVGFTYNYRLDKKISQIETLNNIINDSLSDPIGKNYAENLRNELIKRENYWVQVQNFINQSAGHKLTSYENTVEKKLFEIKLGYLISATGFYCLSIFLIIPIVFFERDLSNSLSQKFATYIVTCVIVIFIIFLLYLICISIPVISKDTLVYNYILNILIQFSLLVLMIKLSKKKL